MGFIGLKTNCLFCGNKSLRVSQNSSRESHLILMKLGMHSSRSFCHLLNLDQAKSVSLFNSASYCESCHQMFTDVLFLQKSIQAFKNSLNGIKALTTSLVLDNYQRCILCEDSPLVDGVGVGGLMDNEYYEALNTIGTVLQQLPPEMRNNCNPEGWGISALEETEGSVGAFLEVRDVDPSEYEEEVMENRSSGVENCEGPSR